jgi:hypothetical protein
MDQGTIERVRGLLTTAEREAGDAAVNSTEGEGAAGVGVEGFSADLDSDNDSWVSSVCSSDSDNEDPEDAPNDAGRVATYAELASVATDAWPMERTYNYEPLHLKKPDNTFQKEYVGLNEYVTLSSFLSGNPSFTSFIIFILQALHPVNERPRAGQDVVPTASRVNQFDWCHKAD